MGKPEGLHETGQLQPMVAPAYARKRQELALKIGLGRKREEPGEEKLAAKPRAKRKAA